MTEDILYEGPLDEFDCRIKVRRQDGDCPASRALRAIAALLGVGSSMDTGEIFAWVRDLSQAVVRGDQEKSEQLYVEDGRRRGEF